MGPPGIGTMDEILIFKLDIDFKILSYKDF